MRSIKKTSVIVGYGSIGSKHAAILSDLGHFVSVVTSQKIQNYNCVATIEDALNNYAVDQIIIANPTYLHCTTLKKILSLNYSGKILIEKPLFSKMENFLDNKLSDNIYVAYNLRFHVLFNNLKSLLENDALVSFIVHVGSYLPAWRKNQDYRNCYSAKKEFGGGVLRDLSHELDYTLWICGQCIELTAIGGHHSALEIDSDDVYSILMRCEKCPVVNIHLDYLNRVPTRKIIINTKKHNTILLDLIGGNLFVNGVLMRQYNDAIGKTYVTQHKKMTEGNFDDFCTYQQGFCVVRLVDAIEQASSEKKWIRL